MTKLPLVLLLLLSTFTVLAQNVDRLISTNVIDQEIIEAMIKSEFDNLTKKPNEERSINLIIDTEIGSFDLKILTYKSVNVFSSKLDKSAYDDFVFKNKSGIAIDTISDARFEIKYFTQEEMDEIFKKGRWGLYHQMFGFADIVRVSRPGLSADGKLALVYYSHSSDGEAGAGYFLIMEKVNKKWRVKEKVMAWIS